MASSEQFSTDLKIEDFTQASVQSLDLPRVLVLTVRGRVSYRNAPRLREIIFEALERSAGRMIVDLGSIDAMDTAGAAVLVEVVTSGRRQRKEVLLCTPSDSVTNMFRLAGLTDVLESCCASRDETFERLHGPPSYAGDTSPDAAGV